MSRVASALVLGYVRHAPFERGKYRLMRLAGRSLLIELEPGLFIRPLGLSTLEREIILTGNHEPETIQAFAALLAPGMTVIDLGANIGQYTLVAARRVGPLGRVYAFEPTPSLAEHARRNLELNGLENATVHAVAVSDAPGRVTLHSVEARRTEHELDRQWLFADPKGLDVPTVTLDGFVAEQSVRAVDVIKMDIEGAELQAFRGAETLLTGADPPVLVLELNPKTLEYSGHTPDDLLGLLAVLWIRVLPDRGLLPAHARPFPQRDRREAAALRPIPGPAAVAAAAIVDMGPGHTEGPRVYSPPVGGWSKAGHTMPEPLISVIIPTFNRAYCIGKAIDSVRTQTHQNTEILVIDDGSTDGTRDLIDRTYADDPRVRYVFHENRGVTATRNRGLALVRGEFVALLDSDDTWSPWKLELQLACFRHRPEIGMVWTDMEAVGPGGEIISRAYLRTMYGAYRWFPRQEQLFPHSFSLAEIAPGLAPHLADRRLHTGDIFSQMIMGNLVHTSTVIIRRETLEKVGRFNEELLFCGEDYDFHLRTCRQGPVGFLDLATIRYQTGMPDRLTRDEYKVYAATNCVKSILPFIEQERARIDLSDRMIRLRLAHVHSWAGERLLNTGESSLARVHLRKSLSHQLWQLKAWKFLALAFASRRTCARVSDGSSGRSRPEPGDGRHQQVAVAKAR